MSVQHTNLDTSQDKGQTGQEVNNQEPIKNNSPDNTVAWIFLSTAFYLALFYLAILLLSGLLSPWGMIVILFLRYSLISFIIATILIGKGLKKENKVLLYSSNVFYLASTLLAYDPAWRPYRVTPFLITLLVTVGTVMYKQDNEQDNK
ncbi:hypothetical protein [uncultured Streptococcus sp.]|uniref:hypothetical protein n=1 Tax=uncultured Streptococcus sp. TaxID=83427 RepID=UPI002598F5A2|nr:hypothetical protein [uncultured Streptococcus sp.]